MRNITNEGYVDRLKYYVCPNRNLMGELAADTASNYIKDLLNSKDDVRIIFASAPSQDNMLYHLTEDKDIDWSRIIGFHMDEYLDLPTSSNRWFKNYLQTNLTNKVAFRNFHFINGNVGPEEESKRYRELLCEKPIDLVCMGVGENGHIAFNDPPVAKFDDPERMKSVELDMASRQQQVNDGSFQSIGDVPTHALTLTIPTLMSASKVVCTVPGSTKNQAVSNILNGPIHTSCPATILRTHKNAQLIMDTDAFGG